MNLDITTLSSGQTLRVDASTTLNATLNLDGGRLDTQTLILSSAAGIAGIGTVNGQVHGLTGSAISLSGDMTLGDATSLIGFIFDGTLDVGATPLRCTRLDSPTSVR